MNCFEHSTLIEYILDMTKADGTAIAFFCVTGYFFSNSADNFVAALIRYKKQRRMLRNQVKGLV